MRWLGTVGIVGGLAVLAWAPVEIGRRLFAPVAPQRGAENIGSVSAQHPAVRVIPLYKTPDQQPLPLPTIKVTKLPRVEPAPVSAPPADKPIHATTTQTVEPEKPVVEKTPEKYLTLPILSAESIQGLADSQSAAQRNARRTAKRKQNARKQRARSRERARQQWARQPERRVHPGSFGFFFD